MNTLLGTVGASTLLAIVVLLLHVEHRLTKVETKLDTANTRTVRQDRTIRAVLAGLVQQATARNREAWIALLAGFEPSFDAIIRTEEVQRNPLTAGELDRLKSYRDKLTRRGEILTAVEAQDFTAIINKLDHDQPKNPDLGPLIFLAAMILGMVAGAASGGGTGPNPSGRTQGE